MDSLTVKSYLAGAGVYAACLGLAALPIFTPSLDVHAIVRLAATAAVSLFLVGAILWTGLDRTFGDPAAKFLQAFLGITICAGLYAVFAPLSEPQIVLMSLLWIAVGLTLLTPAEVGALAAVYLVIYGTAFSAVLLDGADTRHSEALFTLLVSAVLIVFMYLRSREYERVRQERTLLQGENARQAEQLREAALRIHAVTVQDMDTIALKYPYFKKALQLEKERADGRGGTFSIGLIEIDHFAALSARHGELVAKQLLRETARRATDLVRKMGLLEEQGEAYQPLGRVGEHLFGMILPTTNLKGALACAQRMHQELEFHAINTATGPVSITLSIGVIEYVVGEDVDDLLADLGRSLEKARLANEEMLRKAERPQAPKTPVKAASSQKDMRLLDYKEYTSPLH